MKTLPLFFIALHAIAGLLSITVAQPKTAWSGIIDFETSPGGLLPVDNAPLDHTTPYITDGVAVTFGFDTTDDGSADTNAVFERRGVDFENAFFSVFGPAQFDTERVTSPQALGEFFLRQPASIGAVPGVFVISYDQDVSGFRGEIWDIDAGVTGFEQWRVSSFDAANNLLAAIESPVGLDTNDTNSMDSLAWEFSFAGANIRRVELEFIGTNPIVGLAFNNYNATSAIPEIPGDFDHDGDVDGRDFLVWQRGNSTNGINSGDLALWQSQYGSPLASSRAVPEPGTALLGCFVSLVVWFSRMRLSKPL